MKERVCSRFGLAHVRDVLQQVCDRTVSVEQACASLGMAKTRLYDLHGSFLKARAEGTVESWRPGPSGGNHAAPWNMPVYPHFLHGALMQYGLPLEVYVDQAGIFTGIKKTA